MRGLPREQRRIGSSTRRGGWDSNQNLGPAKPRRKTCRSSPPNCAACCSKPAACSPRVLSRTVKLRSEDAVEFVIDELSLLLHVLTKSAFILHAEFLHDASRGRIVVKMIGMDAVEPALGEGVAQDRARRFRAITTAPIRFADPVSKLGLFVVEIYDEADSADKFATGLERDGDHSLLAFLEMPLMRADPLLGHPILVRVGDA